MKSIFSKNFNMDAFRKEALSNKKMDTFSLELPKIHTSTVSVNLQNMPRVPTVTFDG